jgi:hypothetical protein
MLGVLLDRERELGEIGELTRSAREGSLLIATRPRRPLRASSIARHTRSPPAGMSMPNSDSLTPFVISAYVLNPIPGCLTAPDSRRDCCSRRSLW